MEKGQVFGQSCTELLAKYDQNTRSLKTFQLLHFEEEPESLEILPKSGMTVNGKLWEQTMWAHPTGERESGLWPTPRAMTISNKMERLTPEGRMSADGKQRFGLNLQDAVKMWPTPQHQDHKPGPNQHQDSLGRRARRAGGHLNPQWVEWLMGYPIGWTA